MDASDTRRQLGRIMVEEGFITAEQLTHALEEQNRTGKPLGKVLVELEFVSAGAVANALAEQHGGLLKTEFGVSAGLQRRPRPAVAVLPVEKGTVPGTVPAERDEAAAELLAALGEERDRLEAALAELETAATTRIAELQALLQAAADEREPFVDELLATRLRAAEAEAALESAVRRIADLEAAPPVPEPLPAPVAQAEPERERAHLLLVPSPAGYELLEREGPAPASGALVDLGGLSFRVGRVRNSPFPDGGVARRCAVLEPV